MIYADFNSTAESGGVWCLWVPGNAEEIAQFQTSLEDGLRVVLYMDEVRVLGQLRRDAGRWYAFPDWETVWDDDNSNRPKVRIEIPDASL
jgi:hypothetical protein